MLMFFPSQTVQLSSFVAFILFFGCEYMLELIVTVFILQEIDRKEARINAMRCAILETFPEPNRRLLQRCSLSLSLFSPLPWL